jgi:Tetratricopeptide repeat
MAYYRQALHLQPANAEAHINLGIGLWDQNKLAEAMASFQEALRLHPASAEARTKLGMVLADQGKLAEAKVCFQQALRLQPANAEAHTSLAILQLLHGDFAQGWPEYEWRWQCKRFNKLPTLSQPLWDGAPLSGRTLLVQGEQGLGDTLQFVRYLPLVQKSGGKVVMRCQPLLRRLLQSCAGIDQVVAYDTALPPCDCRMPVLSLPRLLGTTLATIPAEVPYLRPDPNEESRWRAELAALVGFRVGIAWQGNPEHPNDCRRSVPLEQFAPLAGVPEVRLVSLQQGPGSEQLAGAAFPITALGERLADFATTAAVVRALDLVVCVDTAVAHLAGAVGAPVWVALPFLPDWRWLLDREDSPWYPTMRLFRQPQPGQWAEVFATIAAEVGKRVQPGRSSHR